MQAAEDGYEGPATLHVEDVTFQVTVVLGGQFQPLDGHYRWYGRLAPHEELTRLIGDRTVHVLLTTPQGTAGGLITEADLWHRYRIEGTSVPPFRVPFGLEDVTVEDSGAESDGDSTPESRVESGTESAAEGVGVRR